MHDTIRDTVEASLVGTGAIYALGTDIELGLKILVALASLSFIIYKWVKESKRP